MQTKESKELTALLLKSDDVFDVDTPLELIFAPPPGEAGLLSFAQIVLLLTYAEVLSFNHRRDVVLEFGASWITVSSPGRPQIVFNEDAAPEAVISGNLLWMPDAQGFGLTFELDCILDVARLKAKGGANG